MTDAAGARSDARCRPDAAPLGSLPGTNGAAEGPPHRSHRCDGEKATVGRTIWACYQSPQFPGARVLVLLLFAAGTDFKDRRIPNEVAIAVAAIGFAQSLLIRPGSVWLSVVVASALFCGLAVLSHRRIIGGGDVKLLSAATLLVPPTQVGRLLVDIALAGGVFACLYLAARFRLKMSGMPTISSFSPNASGFAVAMSAERRRIAAGGPMPYALAIFGGVCLYVANESLSCSSASSCLS